MTSFKNIWLSELHIVEFNESYYSAKFHWLRLSGSNFTGGGVENTPSDLHALKNPSLYRVKGCRKLNSVRIRQFDDASNLACSTVT